MNNPSVRTEGIQVGRTRARVSTSRSKIADPEPLNQRLLYCPRQREAARLIVEHAGPIVGERVHPIRQCVVVHRNQQVRADRIRQFHPREEVQTLIPRPGHDDPRAMLGQQVAEFERHTQIRLSLPEPGWTSGTARRVARIDYDHQTLKWVARIDRRRPADLEHKLVPDPAGSISPHRRLQLKGDRHFVGRFLQPANIPEIGVGRSVPSPVDVAHRIVESEHQLVLTLLDPKRHPLRHRNTQRQAIGRRSERDRGNRPARCRRPRGKWEGVRDGDPGLLIVGESNPEIVAEPSTDHRAGARGKEPVIGGTGTSSPHRQAVGVALRSGVIVELDQLRDRIEQCQAQRPADTGGVATDDGFEHHTIAARRFAGSPARRRDCHATGWRGLLAAPIAQEWTGRGSQRHSPYRTDVSVGASGNDKIRGVAVERQNARCDIGRTGVRSQRHYRSPRQEQPNRGPLGRTNAERQVLVCRPPRPAGWAH